MSEMQEKPPFLKQWRNIYAAVIGFLVLQIVVYIWISMQW